LLAGSDAYKKQGGKFVKRALARLITNLQLIDSLPIINTICAQDRITGAHVQSLDECEKRSKVESRPGATGKRNSSGFYFFRGIAGGR
jgi:hypothetical protein